MSNKRVVLSKQTYDLLAEHFARNAATTNLNRCECLHRARHALGLPPLSNKVARVRSCLLGKQPKIIARIAQLRASQPKPQLTPHPREIEDRKMMAKVEAKVALTREWVIDQLVANVERAKATKQLNVVNKALHLLGLEVGMFATVVRHGSANDPEQLTDAELTAIIRAGYNGTGSADLVAPPDDPKKLN